MSHGVRPREDKYLQPIADTTPTQIRITRACLAPLHLGGRVQPVQPGAELTLPRDVADQIVRAGKAEFL
jgi:hypothetical protein